jgi:hypothetical protein
MEGIILLGLMVLCLLWVIGRMSQQAVKRMKSEPIEESE